MSVQSLAFSPEQLAEVRRLQALYPDPRGALLPVLYMAQETFGHISLPTEERYLTTRPKAAMQLLRTLSTRLRETNEMLSQRAAKNAVQEVESKLTWSQKLADQAKSLFRDG